MFKTLLSHLLRMLLTPRGGVSFCAGLAQIVEIVGIVLVAPAEKVLSCPRQRLRTLTTADMRDDYPAGVRG